MAEAIGAVLSLAGSLAGGKQKSVKIPEPKKAPTVDQARTDVQKKRKSAGAVGVAATRLVKGETGVSTAQRGVTGY